MTSKTSRRKAILHSLAMAENYAATWTLVTATSPIYRNACLRFMADANYFAEMPPTEEIHDA